MKRIAQFVIGAGLGYGAGKFGCLTFSLLAAGQFFTVLAAAFFAFVCAVAAALFIMESLD